MDLLRRDRETALARALAEAEVRLCAAERALEKHLSDPVAPGRTTGLADLVEEAKGKLMLRLERQGAPGLVLQDLLDQMRRRIRSAAEIEKSAPERERLLRRNAREAQGQRRRAFANWIAYLTEQRKEGGQRHAAY